MEEKYLVCYPVYKFWPTSDQSHNGNFEKHQSVWRVRRQSCKLKSSWQEISGTWTQPLKVDQMASNDLLHECGIWMWKMYWENPGITKTEQKYMIWGLIFFFFNSLAIILSRHGPGSSPCSWKQLSVRRLPWRHRLPGVGHSQGVGSMWQTLRPFPGGTQSSPSPESDG